MMKWFNNLKSISIKEDSQVNKMTKLLYKMKNSDFGKNYLVENSLNGGDFSYSNLIFFDFNSNVSYEDIYDNSPVLIRNIDEYKYSNDIKVSIRKKDYHGHKNIVKIDEYNALLETLVNKYNALSTKDKSNIANDYIETLEKLYNFTLNSRVYLINNDDYDLVKVTLALILDNMENDLSIDKNSLREELKMEVKYLNSIREKQLEMKEFERGLK